MIWHRGPLCVGDKEIIAAYRGAERVWPPPPPPELILVFEPTASGSIVAIPLRDGVNVEIDWGDGTAPQPVTTANPTHVYAAAGTYTVVVSGQAGTLGGAAPPAAWRNNVTQVLSFGNLGITRLDYAFQQAGRLRKLPSALPSGVTTMASMLYSATTFNQDLSTWDTSSVTDMSYMFGNARAFNQDLSTWNVSSVTNMRYMFSNAIAFNQDLSTWDTSSVTDMSFMLNNATAFNQDIGAWNVSSVTNMRYMFSDATAFDQDIGAWDVSSVTDMSFMFNNARAFNQDISAWNVSSVTNMQYTFSSATAFDQDIGAWDVSSVTDMASMFRSVTLSTPNYDGLLNGWSQRTLQPSTTFGGGGSKYSPAAATARAHIINTYGWTITDGGPA